MFLMRSTSYSSMNQSSNFPPHVVFSRYNSGLTVATISCDGSHSSLQTILDQHNTNITYLTSMKCLIAGLAMLALITSTICAPAPSGAVVMGDPGCKDIHLPPSKGPPNNQADEEWILETYGLHCDVHTKWLGTW